MDAALIFAPSAIPDGIVFRHGESPIGEADPPAAKAMGLR
jgi:hypothetical protein